MDLKWFESKVGNKYLNESAGIAAEEEAASRTGAKAEVERLYLKGSTLDPCFVFVFLNKVDF